VGPTDAAPPQVTSPQASRSHLGSGAVCAGSNPAGGTLYKVPKDPVTSGNAEAGVFAYVQLYAAPSGRMSGPWTIRGHELEALSLVNLGNGEGPRRHPGAAPCRGAVR